MTCHDAREKLPLYSGGELPLRLKSKIRGHLNRCEACRVELGKIQRTRQLMSEAYGAMQVEPPDDRFWEQVLYRLPRRDTEDARAKTRRAKKVTGRLVPVLAGLAAIAVILVFGIRRPGMEIMDPITRPPATVPLVEGAEPGVTVMTFQTEDPKMTIVWFFEDQDQS